MNKKVLLLILDGWGITNQPEASAIYKAQTPYIDKLYTQYPNTTLRTDGQKVGLPNGQMGNSEVGHMNLGAGRIVYQDLAKVNLTIENNTLKDEKTLVRAFKHAKAHHKPMHFMGLVSDGGVHSHINHLKGLITAAYNFGLEKIFVHAFTDGRDVDPRSGLDFIEDLQKFCKTKNTKIASITGRYYAMDRDNRWERTARAWNAIVKGEGKPAKDPVQAIKNSYKNKVTDEFIEPVIVHDENGDPTARLKNGDVVLFFNFRTDRGRQLTRALSQENIADFGMKKLDLHYVTLTNYDDTFKNVEVIYDKEKLKNTLGEVLAKNNKTQIRIAETEKYPHVTFFFNGGREEPFKGEKRILCPSPKVATYDLKPEMSAFEIRDKIIDAMKAETPDFICLNFANPDMVGHTGVMEAAVKACETVDACVAQVCESAKEKEYTVLVLADHGNCETMINPDGSANTAHTTNPVPLIVIDEDIDSVKSGILGDIAPTVLKLMGLKQPVTMTQKALI